MTDHVPGTSGPADVERMKANEVHFRANFKSDRSGWLDEPVSVTLPRRTWMVVVGAARDFDVRVPGEQGDGGACLDTIDAAIGSLALDEEQADG